MNIAVVEKWLDRYPKLEYFMDAGTISLKMAREIIDVDRYFMYDMFKEFVTAGAVTASGSNAWRATKELKDYLKQRREQNKSGD
nr:MAG TPA: DeoR-like helix-turn-helix domain [Caudoviricetes sp.]